MRETTRNFSHLGAYVFGTALLFSSFALAATIVLREFADTPFVSWTAAVLEPAPKEPTRLSVAVTNAREIRAALAKPIPGPDPLPPITAKLAYGHLKPGGKGINLDCRSMQKMLWQWILRHQSNIEQEARCSPNCTRFIEQV